MHHPTCTANPGIAVFSPGGAEALTASTVFRVVFNGTRPVFLANKESTVRVAGAPQFSFRNPPQFMSYADPASRDAAYETEWVLDHLFYHKNTAPFVVHKLIQRLITSNPSPRYQHAVSRAFINGTYDGIGSATYGDMAATVAAVLLDREARSPILDSDPSFGRLREPLLMLIHLMRAMEFAPAAGLDVQLDGLAVKTGQEQYNSPTVFNFFLPDYTPAGAVMVAGLRAPEAQLATAPHLVRTLNGLSSLIRNGLTSCDDGFGSEMPMQNMMSMQGMAMRDCADKRGSADGGFTWVPADAANATRVVDELSLLLTAGRLNANNKQLIAEIGRAHV